jgi:ribosomal protein S6 kinase alpha-4
LDEPSVAFLGAQVVVALSHLHYLGIVYRGVCAASVVVTAAGLSQLVDFRFARRAAADAGGGRCFSLCGVPEYMAPELVAGTGHTDAVDWWALGVLLWELLCGASPFAAPGDDELTIYRRIARAQLPSPLPAHLSPEAQSLLTSLLARDPRDRLGAGRGGTSALRAHPFFASIDWPALSEGRAPLPLGVRDRMLSAAAAAAAAGGSGEGGGVDEDEDGVVDLGAWAAPAGRGGGGRRAREGAAAAQEEPLWVHEF